MNRVVISTSTPLVSVVVPVYNGARYLGASLDSIIRQTYPKMEIVVMDDASTDETPALLAAYGDTIAVYRQDSNRGQFRNVNDGIRRAHGDYIAVYHADDIYEPIIVEKEVKFLEDHPEAGAVFALDVFIDPAGHEYGRLTLPGDLVSSDPLPYDVILNGLLTYKNRFLVGPTAMVPSRVYRHVGLFHETYGIAADLEMWARIARQFPIGILDRHLHRYRHGHGNLTQGYYLLRAEPEHHFSILDEHLAAGGGALATAAALAAHEAHRAEDFLMLAINTYILGRHDESRQWLRRISAQRIVGSNVVQRSRLLVLFALLHVLARLPRISVMAKLFYWRWHRRSRVWEAGLAPR